MLILLDLAGIAFFFSLVLTPYVRDAALRFNLVDHPDSARKFHSQPIPRVGGIAIATAYVLAFGLILILPYRGLAFNIHTVVPRALGLLPAAGLVFFIGFIDDIWGLKPWQKLLGQFVAALLAFWAGVRIDFLQWHQLHLWVSLPVTVIWLIGCANAFNLIDGLDGLAAGVGLFATVTTLVAGLINNNLQLVLVTAPLVGCLLGFLRYNFNPASIFLGDSGSLLIGFLLGCYGAMWSQKSATLIGLTAPMMAMAIPLMDVALSIVRRFLRNQPIFGADRGHIHHRLLERGLTPRRAALFLYGICGVAATLSLLQDLVHDRAGGAILVLFCVVAWIGVQHLGYTEFGIAGRLFMRGTLRSFVDVQLRLHEFERRLAVCSTTDQYCQAIAATSRQLGFSGIRIRLDGEVVEEVPSSASWQLRLDFPDLQYVNIYLSYNSSPNPGLLTGFAQIIERVLRARFVAASPAPLTPLSIPVPAEAAIVVKAGAVTN